MHSTSKQTYLQVLSSAINKTLLPRNDELRPIMSGVFCDFQMRVALLLQLMLINLLNIKELT